MDALGKFLARKMGFSGVAPSWVLFEVSERCAG